MKDESDIEKMLDIASEQCEEPTAPRHGMSYEDGVRSALEWVLGMMDKNESPFN